MKSRKPKLPPEQKRSIPAMAYVTPDEYAQIKAIATQAGLTLSEYIRRVSLGHKIESQIDQKAVLELLKFSADLGRLGGLLKQAMQQGQQSGMWPNLYLQINRLQTQVREKADAL